ncbi:sperm acrosome-associated protein 9 [Erpetoichthys calabaricus]|uniref:sperm acrosome-associated protein 9 n=1 Tax=Erpetoichthys calabaricus TaxID=27687 RepID=UPI0010A03232|nr:sperm acrosome-associated protein 9 [Erpetoichthys calabaricus]
MEKLKNKLSVIQQKVQRFRQQQFTFITALERTRERAQQRTKPISSIAQVQCCLDEYCQNATDRRVLSLFLEIVHDLNGLLQQTENQFTAASNQQIESLEECKRLLNPNNDLSRLRARYPHDEVNRLSCDEARNYYGGVVSLIPIILDHLQQGLLAAERLQRTAKPVVEGGNEVSSENPDAVAPASTPRSRSGRVLKKTTGTQSLLHCNLHKPNGHSELWHGGKPAWRPPGRTNKF